MNVANVCKCHRHRGSRNKSNQVRLNQRHNTCFAEGELIAYSTVSQLDVQSNSSIWHPETILMSLSFQFHLEICGIFTRLSHYAKNPSGIFWCSMKYLFATGYPDILSHSSHSCDSCPPAAPLSRHFAMLWSLKIPLGAHGATARMKCEDGARMVSRSLLWKP